MGAAIAVLLALAAPLAAQTTAPPAPSVSTEAPSLAAPVTETAPAAPLATAPPATATAPATAPPTAAETAPLSPLGMYRAAHWIVQAVILSLIFASFVTWTVFLFKTVELTLAGRRLRASRSAIDRAATLAEAEARLAGQRDPAAFMVGAASEECRRSGPAPDRAGVKERVASLLAQTEAQAARHLRRGTGLLATIGATAPFVGLFGTVWGIMNAFIAIAETKTTNLAVVAPGIAEALLATAIGLVAAIPAVILYNLFTRAIGAYRQGLGDASAGIARLVSRDLDRAPAPVDPAGR